MSACGSAWLLAVQAGEVDDDIGEPPLPPGLADPHAPLAALAGFLRLDRDLLGAAAEASPAGTADTTRLRAWVRALPAAEQQRWLLRAVDEPDRRLGADLRAEFRRTHATAPPADRRTVGCGRYRHLRTRSLLIGGLESAPTTEEAGPDAGPGEPQDHPGGVDRVAGIEIVRQRIEARYVG